MVGLLLPMRQVSREFTSLRVTAFRAIFPTFHVSKSVDQSDFGRSAAMGTRRQNLIRWTPHMDECLRDLENSKEALLSDKSLCQWVKLQRLADDLGTQISPDDASHIDTSDQKIQYALKGFERQMSEWGKQKSAEITSRECSSTLKRSTDRMNRVTNASHSHFDPRVPRR